MHSLKSTYQNNFLLNFATSLKSSKKHVGNNISFSSLDLADALRDKNKKQETEIGE